MRLIVIILIGTLCLSAFAKPTSCSFRNNNDHLRDIVPIAMADSCGPEFVKQRLKEKQTVQAVLDQVLRRDSQIIALGEIHSFGAGKWGYKKLLQQFESIGFEPDCITIEGTSDTQTIIDTEMASEFIDRERYVSAAGTFGGDQIPQALEYAKKNKIKVYAVDKGYGWPTIEQAIKARNLKKLDQIRNDAASKLTLSERNIYMADKIADLIQSNKCKKIIHIGGFHHQSLILAPSDNLQILLDNRGLKTLSIGIQPTSDLRAWGHFVPTALRCFPDSPDFESTENGFGIIPEGLNQVIAPLDENGDGSLWKDFDSILFFPPED